MAEGIMMFEKRGCPRISVNFKAEYQTSYGDEREESRVADIAVTGVRIYSFQEFKPGDRLRVIIEVDDGKKIEAEAVVRWINTSREMGLEVGYDWVVGMSFSKIEKEDSSYIADIVERSLKGE